MPFIPCSHSPTVKHFFKCFCVYFLLSVCSETSPKCWALNRSDFFDYDLNSQKGEISYFKYLTSNFQPLFEVEQGNIKKNSKCKQDSGCRDGSKCFRGDCIQLGDFRSGHDKYLHCSGKSLFSSSDKIGHQIETNNFPDGLSQYLSGNECSWLLRNLNSGKFQDINNNQISEFPPFTQLEIERFNTEFGNDYLYVFNGDSIYSPLIAALR